MPGAMPAHLSPGDFMLYRQSAWHLGNYVPYRKRATLHDSVVTPEVAAKVQEWLDRLQAARQRRAQEQPAASR